MRALSLHQARALACLARGPLKYTVAGYTAATQSNAGIDYVSPQTIQALVRRSFASLHDVRGRRDRRALITPAGRRRHEAEASGRH